MSLLLLVGRGGAVTGGSGVATLVLGATGTGRTTHSGASTAGLILGAVGTGERPAAPGEKLGYGVATLILGAVGVGQRPAVEVSTEIWVNETGTINWFPVHADTIVSSLSVGYGLTGNRPTDSLAGSGTLSFSLRNDARTDGRPAGYYSPNHVNCRAGWTVGVELFLWMTHGTRYPGTATITGTTMTVTTSAAHGFAPDEFIKLDGAGAFYDFVYRIVTVPTPTSVTIQLLASLGDGPIAGTVTIRRGYVRFWGRVDTIDPEPGPAFRRAHVTAFDRMRDLLDADLVNIDIQINKTESEVMAAIFAALDTSIAPRRSFLDAGIDQLQVVLDDLGPGTRAGAVVSDILRSSYGIGAFIQDGVFRYISRNTRATTASSATFASTMSGLSAATSMAKVFNEFRTTTHPRTIDASNVVLWAATGTPSAIPPGATVVIAGTFRDPNDVLRLIGASATVTPVSGTDWIANSSADGSGTNLTASVAVVATVYATKVDFSVTNSAAAPAYLTTLQIRGRGVYDNGPRTFTSPPVGATFPSGKRTFALDLPYQNVDALGQQIADFGVSQYGTIGPQTEEIVLRASPESSPTLFAEMMFREIGDVITITEAQTGVTSVTAMILGYQMQALTYTAFEVRWRLGPVVTIARPGTPTGLTVTTIHDTALRASWTTATAGSYTQIYLDGILLATAGIGETHVDIFDLTPATNYSVQVRHLYFGLTSELTAAVVGRPHVAGTGGTEFDSGGLHYHVFNSSGSFTMTVPGRINITGVGGGGGGGAYQDNTGSGGGPTGGGGGGGGRVEFLGNEEEPAGVHAIVIGNGGAGAPTLGQNGTIGGQTTYRVDHMICEGGGRGAGGSNAPNTGGTGGSGGGGAGTGGGAGGTQAGGAGVGFNGGNGGTNPGGAVGGGGGGGAGGPGGNATTIGGAGGLAYQGYAAGGTGGRGTAPAAGAANTGNGGGGGQESHPTGFAGGSGVLIINYPI